MENMSFIAFMMSHTAEDVSAYLEKKAKRDLPDNLSKLAKYLIKQDGQKKEDIFRSTGLSRDYLYKVLRGVKKIKERDYILAICLAAHMDLIDTQIMLEAYGLPALSIDAERDVVIIHAINGKMGLEKTDKMLLSAGIHKVCVSPENKEDDSPISFSDLQIEQIDVTYDLRSHNFSICAKASVNDRTIFYTSIDGKENEDCKNTDQKFLFLLHGIAWQKVRDLIVDTQKDHDETTMIPVYTKNGDAIIAETKSCGKYYQMIRYEAGNAVFSSSSQNARTYFYAVCTHNTLLYRVLFGLKSDPDYVVMGGDLEELQGADDQDVAVCLRLKREVRIWRMEHGFVQTGISTYSINGISGKAERDQIRTNADAIYAADSIAAMGKNGLFQKAPAKTATISKSSSFDASFADRKIRHILYKENASET